MLYIKIGDDKYEAKIGSFTTQKGNDAIRVTSDAPTAEGFVIVDDEDNVITDRSDYTYLYREGNGFKEYTKVEDAPVPVETFAMGDVPQSAIERQISALNRRVNELTPYTVSKTGYYGESEKVFYDVPEGNTIVFFDRYNGEYSIERISNRLIVRFNTLDKETAITVQVQ